MLADASRTDVDAFDCPRLLSPITSRVATFKTSQSRATCRIARPRIADRAVARRRTRHDRGRNGPRHDRAGCTWSCTSVGAAKTTSNRGDQVTELLAGGFQRSQSSSTSCTDLRLRRHAIADRDSPRRRQRRLAFRTDLVEQPSPRHGLEGDDRYRAAARAARCHRAVPAQTTLGVTRNVRGRRASGVRQRSLSPCAATHAHAWVASG